MTRVEQAMHAMASGPATIPALMSRFNWTEPQARAVIANLNNRLLVKRIEGTRPMQYQLTEAGKSFEECGKFKHPWKQGYMSLLSGVAM